MKSGTSRCIYRRNCCGVLQEGEITAGGGTETITVDSRVVAATNRDLTAMIGSGQFREDLF